MPEPDCFRLHLLPGLSINLNISPSEQTVPFNVKRQPHLVLHPSRELHAQEHISVLHHRRRAVESGQVRRHGGTPLARGFSSALVEWEERGVGERSRGGVVEEERKGDENGAVFDALILVGVLKGELEEEGVVLGEEREGLEGAFGRVSAETEPEEER